MLLIENIWFVYLIKLLLVEIVCSSLWVNVFM